MEIIQVNYKTIKFYKEITVLFCGVVNAVLKSEKKKIDCAWLNKRLQQEQKYYYVSIFCDILWN